MGYIVDSAALWLFVEVEIAERLTVAFANDVDRWITMASTRSNLHVAAMMMVAGSI